MTNPSLNVPAMAPPRVSWVVPALIARWRIIFLAAGLLSAALLTAIVIRGPAYEIKASLLVKLGREMVDPELIAPEHGVVPMKRQEDVRSELAILESTELVEAVVDEMGVDYFYMRPPATTLFQQIRYAVSDAKEWLQDSLDAVMERFGLGRTLSRREKIVMRLRSIIQADSENQSDVINLTMYLRDPEAGVEFLTRFIAHYLAAHVDVHKSDQAQPFFSSQFDRIHTDLDAASRERAALLQRERFWSLTERRSHLLKWREQLRASQEASSADLQQASGEATTSTAEERQRIFGRLRMIEADLEETQLALDALDEAELKLADLDREIKRLEQDFSLYAGKYSQARIMAAMDLAKISNVVVVTPPMAGAHPATPSLKLIIAGIVVVGFGAPIAVVLLHAMIHPAVHDREDLADALGARVLAWLPETEAKELEA